MELNSKPNSPMIRYKSSENLNERSDANVGPVLNIEEVEQSEMQIVNKTSKKGNNMQNGQVVLVNVSSFRRLRAIESNRERRETLQSTRSDSSKGIRALRRQ